MAYHDILVILAVIGHGSAGDARLVGERGHFGRGQVEKEWRTGDGDTAEDEVSPVFVINLWQEASHPVILQRLVLSGSDHAVTDGFWTRLDPDVLVGQETCGLGQEYHFRWELTRS